MINQLQEKAARRPADDKYGASATGRFRFALLSIAFACPVAALAGAVTDGSVGAVETLSGRFKVPQTLGSIKGGNLFHSFASFGVASGESATFTTTSASIVNVIARVTGGAPSAIYGPLTLKAASGSQPDFFFINPAGVLFGAGAQIDVPGGFHVSTAQQLKFADGFVWDTGKPTVSGLSIAAPEAFGLLGRSSPAAVRFTNLDANGNTGDSPSIVMPAGRVLNVAGGDVSFDGTSLRLPAVSIQVAATGTSAAEVPLDPFADEPGTPLGGAIRLSGSGLSVDGPGAVVLRGDSIDLWQSRIVMNSFDLPADSKAGTLHLRAAGELSIRQSQIVSETNCDAPSTPISVTAGTLTMEGPDSGLMTVTDGGRGDAGAIDVIVGDAMRMSTGAMIRSDSRSGGHAGSLSIRAKSARIDGHGDYTGIVSTTSRQPGDAGNVLVDIENDLAITDGGVIGSVVSHLGRAGAVVIRATTLDISCAACGSVTGITDLPVAVVNPALAEGESGSIDIEIKDSMRLAGDVLVRSDSGLSSGKAGNIRIKATSLEIDGSNGHPSIDTSSVNGDADAGNISIVVAKDMLVTGKGKITTHTKSAGNAGSIDISVGGNLAVTGGVTIGSDSLDFSKDAGSVSLTVGGAVTLTKGASITSRSQDYSGDAGSVSIKAAELTVRGSADVSSVIMTDAQRGDGKAGDIAIDAGRVTIAAGGLISSSSASAGAGGNVALKVGTLSIDGGDASDAGKTGIFASAAAGSSGQAGHLQIHAGDGITLRNGGTLSIRNDATVADPSALVPSTLSVSATSISLDHAEITAASTGNAGAGDIDITAGNRLTLKSSSVRTSAVDGDGGSIRLAGKLIRLNDSLVTTSVEGQTNGNGGNIDITGNALVLKSGFIQANTLAPLARGGNIRINTRLLIPEGGTLLLGGARVPFGPGYTGLNVIQAAAPDGVAGDLQITTPELNLAGTLSGLATPVVDFGPMARDQCRTGAGSSLTLMGSGALPASVANLDLFGQ